MNHLFDSFAVKQLPRLTYLIFMLTSYKQYMYQPIYGSASQFHQLALLSCNQSENTSHSYHMTQLCLCSYAWTFIFVNPLRGSWIQKQKYPDKGRLSESGVTELAGNNILLFGLSLSRAYDSSAVVRGLGAVTVGLSLANPLSAPSSCLHL